jgi:hypothetical protein
MWAAENHDQGLRQWDYKELQISRKQMESAMNTNYDRPTLDEYLGGSNPDTALLAEYLKQAYADVLLARIPYLTQEAYDAAWYRVAERAKELRA